MNMNKNNLITLIILDVLVMLLAAGLFIYRFNTISFSPVLSMEKNSKPAEPSGLETMRASFSDTTKSNTENNNKTPKKRCATGSSVTVGLYFVKCFIVTIPSEVLQSWYSLVKTVTCLLSLHLYGGV